MTQHSLPLLTRFKKRVVVVIHFLCIFVNELPIIRIIHQNYKDTTMNKNEQFVITINRELGSGGRTVGRLLAEKLGVPYYDKALIKALQEKYQITVDKIEKLKGSKQTWWDDIMRLLDVGSGSSNFYLPQKGDETDMLSNEEIFKVETGILQNLAAEKSCVVAGRSGFHVFRDHPNHLSVLIQASMPFRIQRVMHKQNMTEDEARKTIEKIDKMRENYVQKCTGTSRYDTRNYQVVLCADGKTEEQLVDIIMQYIG